MPRNPSFSVAEFIKYRRLALNCSRHKLAVLAGCSKNHIRDYELGRRQPSLLMSLKLMFCLGISSKKFFKAIGYKEPSSGIINSLDGSEPWDTSIFGKRLKNLT